MRRIVVTGTGRSGTQYTNALLNASGLKSTHETIYYDDGCRQWPDDQYAEVSCFAACHLERVHREALIVQLVRHPLAVVNSWMLREHVTHSRRSPSSRALHRAYSDIWKHKRPQDRILAMWYLMNVRVSKVSSFMMQLESLDVDVLKRVLRLAGSNDSYAADAIESTQVVDRFSHRSNGIQYEPKWTSHDATLASNARALARDLGYHNA